MTIQGECVRITGRPDVDCVTITIGETCEITLPAHEARLFALLLRKVAVTVHREHLGAGMTALPVAPAERVM